MPRIRTIKPEFFRDEALQDVQSEWSGVPVMLVYAGLWGHCDKAGTFEWKPRQLKLDILPFLPFSMDQALEILEGAGFIQRYEIEGKTYGHVPKFEEHQRINGKEAQEPEKYPRPPEKQRGSNGEAPEKQPRRQEGKGREGNISTGANAPDGFLKFWSAWPKHPRKGGKSECLKVWRSRGLEATAGEIIAHVDSLKTGRAWADAQFIPAPLSYLRKASWDGADATADDPFKGVLGMGQ